jgi:hypothetical protein
MFLIELVLPFFIFAGRRARLVPAAAFTVLMLIVAATGNYTFFNWLTIALCLPLVEDKFLRRLLPRFRDNQNIETPSPSVEASLVPSTAADERGLQPDRIEAAKLTALATFAAVVLLLSGSLLCAQLFGTGLPTPISKLHSLASPLRSVNHYGLFAVMTPTLPVIVVEGSNDGVNWLPYEFKWKAGDSKRAPGFVAPHQPRLDWQMWFAALQDVRSNPWFVNFLAHLLRGTPEVLALIETNPFPAAPPRSVRAVLYEYHFTDYATRAKTGEWWRREVKGMYCPPVSFKQ